MAVQSHEEILEQLLANEREDIEHRNRIRRFFGLKSKPVPDKTIKPCLTANSSDKPSVGKKISCESSLSKVSMSKSAALEHLDISNLSANVLLQSEMFKSINGSYFRERDYLEGYTSPGSFLNTKKFELGFESLSVHQVYNADQYSEYPRYEKYGESGSVRKENTQNRILISLSRYFIYSHLCRSLEKVQRNSLYWQQYAISIPTPMSKEVAYIDLSISENKIRDIETNEVIAVFTGDPYGAGAVFIDMIASKHGEFTIDWFRNPQAPRDFRYKIRVYSKYMEFLLYEPWGNWCQKK